MTRTLTQRLVAMIAVVSLTLAVAWPLLSNAQDATPAMTEDEQIERGAAIFYSVCVACHQPDGAGIPGIFLQLNAGGLVALDDPTLFIHTVLYGRGGMPRFNTTYSDEDIAAVITFVRTQWNEANAVSAAEVAAVRAAYSATPIVSPTPDAQIPEGQNHPEERTDVSEGTPAASPPATPAS